MERKIRTCDVCRKVIPDEFYKIEIEKRSKYDVYESLMVYADLCEDCFRKLIGFMEEK